MKTNYYGDFTLDPNLDWVDASNFSLNVLHDDLDVDYEANAIPEVISMWRQPLDSNTTNFKEFRVLRNGQWRDSVYFDHRMTEEEVRLALIEHDNYPTDIIVLPVKKG